MKRDEAIYQLRSARKELQDTLVDLTEEEYVRANAVNKWSVQDLLAYLAAWDEETVRILQTFPMPGESVYTYTISDRNDFAVWNQEQIVMRRNRPPAEVLQEFEKARRDLIQVVEGLTDAVLNRSRMTSWGKHATGFDLIMFQVERERKHAVLVRSYRKKRERWVRARKNLVARRKTKKK